MTKAALLTAILLISPLSAQAACQSEQQTLFSCMTAKGKRIQLCDQQQTLEYSFGKPSLKPEIVVQVPRSAATTSQWQGVGRWMSYSVEMPNGTTVYSVFWGVDRLSDEHGIEAGVHVEVNGKHAATVKCGENSKIIQNMEGIDLKATEM